MTIQVPNIASVGLRFELDLQFQVEVNGSVELGFGFDVTVSTGPFNDPLDRNDPKLTAGS